MLCCALVAFFLTAPFWALTRMFAPRRAATCDPLAWRLYGKTPTELASRDQGIIAARIKSVAFAVAGLNHMIRNEINARIHLAATLAVCMAGVIAGLDAADWRWIAVAVLWVWSSEALNTATESICDLVSPSPNQHVRIAKDVAAGAVLVSAVGAAVIGVLTFWPHAISHFQDGPPEMSRALNHNLIVCRARTSTRQSTVAESGILNQ